VRDPPALKSGIFCKDDDRYVTEMLVVLLMPLTSSFSLKPLLETVWNLELFDPSLGEEAGSHSFYHFNLTEDPEASKFVAEVFVGDCQVTEEAVSVGGEYAGKFEIEMTDPVSGVLTVIDPPVEVPTEFNFVSTFPDLLGAHGVFNSTLTYSVTLVNRATFHVSLFSFQADVFMEAIFTRFSIPQHKSWWEEHFSLVSIGFGFGIAILALLVYDRHGAPSLDKKPQKKTD